MSIIAMIKGKIQIINKSKIYNQPSFFASFESEVLINDFSMSELKIKPGEIVFHLLSTKFEISNTSITSINCTDRDETIFQVRLESTFNTDNVKVNDSTC